MTEFTEETTDVPGWPRPDDRMFTGLSADIVAALEPVTEADPVAVLVHLLVALGNAAGRSSFARVGAAEHHLNEFAVFVGRTAGGRKGTAWREVLGLMREADDGWAGACVASGLSSGEGLIHHVRDATVGVTRGKGQAEPAAVLDPGVIDKRLLVVEQELASTLRVMGRDGSTLSASARQAWDGDKLRTLTKNSPTVATGAHISIIGHITADELRHDLDKTEAANGFLNRFLVVCVQRSKLLPDGGTLSSRDRQQFGRAISEALGHARRAGELARDDAARALWYDQYPQLSGARPGLLGAVLSRAEAHVLRLSAMYAVLDLSPVVREVHLLSALAIWDYCEASAEFVFGRSLGNPVADQLLAALKANEGWMSRTEISKHFHKNRSKAEIDAALLSLSSQGLVERADTPTAGRSREDWMLSSFPSFLSSGGPVPEETGGSNTLHERNEIRCLKTSYTNNRPNEENEINEQRADEEIEREAIVAEEGGS